MKIEIPELSLIAMVGASSSGKTTFAREHFKDNFVLSSDFCREVVCDDENNQEISKEAFDLLYFAAGKRLRLGHRTIIDATNLNANDRKAVIRLAKEHDVHAVAIVLDIPEKTLLERNEARTDRHISAKVIKNHYNQVKHSIKKLKKEGFRFVYVLSLEDIDSAEIVYTKLWNDKTDEHGPFDVIGDVHGCYDELVELLEKLGYEKKEVDEGITFAHPESRKAVFVGERTEAENSECFSIAFQRFRKEQYISTRWYNLFFNNDSFFRQNNFGISISDSIDCYFTNGELQFVSFFFARQVFDLGEYYRSATDGEVISFASNANLEIEDTEAFGKMADTWIRRKIAMINDSKVLEKYDASDISQRAAEVGVSITTNGSRIVLPNDKKQIKVILGFLDEEAYKGPFSRITYLANSKRKVNGR